MVDNLKHKLATHGRHPAPNVRPVPLSEQLRGRLPEVWFGPLRKDPSGIYTRRLCVYWDLSRYVSRLKTLYQIGAARILGGDRKLTQHALDEMEARKTYQRVMEQDPRARWYPPVTP